MCYTTIRESETMNYLKEIGKNYRPPKLICFLFLLIPIFLCLLRNLEVNNDTWFLINSGHYVMEHGIAYIEPFTIHQGLNFVMQQWLSCLIFAFIYDVGGVILLAVFVSLIAGIIIYLLYRLCMLVSNQQFYLSIIITFITSSLLCLYYLVGRPQIFSFIIYLLWFYLLESYIKKKKWQYLIPLPLLSLLEVNLHGAVWWMLLCFTLPYLIDGFSFKIAGFKSEKYPLKPLFIVLLILIAAAFINPYGIKTLSYLFIAYKSPILHEMIAEMRMPSLFDSFGFLIYLSIMIVIGIYYFHKNKSIKIRYLCLFLGTCFLALTSSRNYALFIVASSFPLASYLQQKKEKAVPKSNTSYRVLYVSVISLFFFLFSFAFMVLFSHPFSLPIEGAVNYLDKHAKKTDHLYNYFDDGSYLEFRGYKTYIDPRPEVFLKTANGKADILQEYYTIQYKNQSIASFLKKYQFDYLVLQPKDELFKYIKKDKTYEKVYQDKHYQIYKRKSKT